MPKKLPSAKSIRPFAALFFPLPSQWGLRGDPYLWIAMARELNQNPFPLNEAELIAIVEECFEKLTGATLLGDEELSEEKSVSVDKFSHGGMSSGCISINFWRGTAMPLFLDRYREVRSSLAFYAEFPR